MNQIVCISTSPWKPLPMSKQQILSRIPESEIIYFDPPVTYLAPLKDKSAKPKLKAHKLPADRISDHIVTYTLPPVIPFFNKCRLINKLNQKKLARFVKKKMVQHGFDNPILWAYSHTCADITEHIPHSALVYHCVDRHSAFKGLIDPVLVDSMEYDLTRKADMVFCTAKGLQQRLLPYNDKAVFIPNGANYELFSTASVDHPCPDELKDITGPILGFTGALQECIEYSFVAYAAKMRPDWTFVFIGNRLPAADLCGIDFMSNVRFLGVKPQSQLPQYISHFDVCLNLFKSDELTKDVSPLKFYEYLCTGKPIVTTPEPQQVMEFKDLIYVAATAEEFVEKCESAISKSTDEQKRLRMDAGRSCSWDSRASQFVSILRQMNILQ
ncbi:MAG: glycosyltransferase family 1 protein [Ruminococcaceae bacterium]|nr:glycosyltransferase family 1 protein [Oscillospiraceae bacterium]